MTIHLTSMRETISFLQFTKKKLSPAAQVAARKYWKEEFPNRFKFGNTITYGYKHNDSEYEKRKLKEVGNRPQLVRTGALKNAVTSSLKVNKKGMEIRYPRYGKYLIEDKKDFTVIRRKDLAKLRKLTKEIFRNWIKTR